MKTKRRLILASNIVSYVFSFAYFFLTALFYSWGDSLDWMFLAFGLLSLIGGLLVSTVRDQMWGTSLDAKQSRRIVFYSLIGIVSPISFALSAIAVIVKDESEALPKPYVAKEEPNEDKKPFFKRVSTILMIASFAGILAFSFAGQALETSGYQVEISTFTVGKAESEAYSAAINGKSYVIKTDTMEYSVDEYRPKGASSSNKLPAIFLNAGYTRSKESIVNFAMELSRRGAICYAIDSACHGQSNYAGYYTNSSGEETKVGTADGRWGLEYIVAYVYNNADRFSYVDRDRIGAAGHSQGGAASMLTATDMSGGSYEKSIIKAVQISGYCTSLTYYASLLRCNAMLTWGMYEEGYPSGSYENYFAHFVNDANGYGQGGSYTNVEINKGYGSMEDGSYRIITRPKTNHYLTVYSSENVGRACDFFNEALSMGSNLTRSNQLWQTREAMNVLSFANLFLFLVTLTETMIRIPFFAAVKKKKDFQEVETIAVRGVTTKKPKPWHKKLQFWLISILSGVIACLDYYPLSLWGYEIFSDVGAGNYTYFGPCKMLNGVMLWAIVNGLIGLALFFLPKFIEWIVFKIKHRGIEGARMSFEDFKPMKLGFVPWMKTLLLVLIVFATFLGLVEMNYYVFHQYFKLVLVAIPVFTVRSFVTFLMYVPFFFIFYLSNSIRLNCGIGFEGFREKATYLVGILANSLGLAFMLFIQYAPFFENGSVYFSNTTIINVIFSVTIMMALLPVMNRIFFKKTNQVYFGAILNVLIFIFISVGSTANLIPIA